jgi:hypothetical protein
MGLDVMNECIDSTMGRIQVCLLCCLPVTIRGLVCSYNWFRGWSSSLGAQKVGQFLDTSAKPIGSCIRAASGPNRRVVRQGV